LFCMAPSLRPSSVQDVPGSLCPSLYTSSGLSRHVKSAHHHVSLVHIALAFTFQVASQGMSRVLTIMAALSPRLAKLLCLCICLLFLCYTIVLSLLLFGVSFKFNLASFWGCLKLISCALVCFIRSLEPSRMRLNRLFT
jgi:hypothetical protein